MATLFSRIISGEIPSYKLYEDAYTYAFLDIFPQKLGHALIVPKIEVDHFSDVPEPYYSAIFQTAKILSPALQKATGCHRVCTMFLGYEVPHCHYHLLPLDGLEDVHWKVPVQASSDDLQTMQQTILRFLDS
jgi:histidine triad (HIT) family protein